MGAPYKVGLDYFLFDVDLVVDRKLRGVKSKYGYLGTMVYISLLSIIYKDKGYYIEYEDNKDDVLWQLSEILQGKYQPCQDTIAEVIDGLVACGLFSRDHYPKNITSKRVQRTYYRATVDRKMVDIRDDIWLLTIEEMESLSAKHCYYLKRVNRPNNEVNRPINSDNQTNYKQRREEKNISSSCSSTDAIQKSKDDFKNVITALESVKGMPLTEYELRRICELQKEYSEAWVLEAISIMGDAGCFKINYVVGVLNNWRTDGKFNKDSNVSVLPKVKVGRKKSPKIMTNDTDYNDIYSM